MMDDIQGIILVDKPADMSSARLVSRVKSLLKAKKAGHAGTLDPFATGLMICCINRATRLARFFLGGNKTYEAVLCLGIETDTQDFTGRTLAVHEIPAFSEEKIAAQFKAFIGTFQQKPPIYSALKHKGLPLYAYARQGKPVQKPARQILISKLQLRDIALPLIRFEVSCSAGTYVRTLCADLGRAFGCGGHLKELRRLKSSGFDVKDAVSLEALEKAADRKDLKRQLIPLAASLKGMAEWTADPFLKAKIINGVPLAAEDVPAADPGAPRDLIKILDGSKALLAVLEYKKDRRQYDYCCVFN